MSSSQSAQWERKSIIFEQSYGPVVLQSYSRLGSKGEELLEISVNPRVLDIVDCVGWSH